MCTCLHYTVMSFLQILLDVLLLVAQSEGPAKLWGLVLPAWESPGWASWPTGPWWDPVRQHGGVIRRAGGRRRPGAQHCWWHVLPGAIKGHRIGGNSRDSPSRPLRYLPPARGSASAQCRVDRKPESDRLNADFITPTLCSLNPCANLWDEHFWGERGPRRQEDNVVVTLKLDERQ